MSAPSVIVVAGPTASGKTALSIELAGKYNGEIVSADSMQIYRRMDIGTAKATPEERAAVPHHMIDIVEPDENYSVAAYVAAADRCCRDIISRGKIPVITGGTGLYIDSLISGRTFSDGTGDTPLRITLSDEYDTEGGDAMLKKLAAVDPERAGKLHPADKRRIVRALEIYMTEGITASEHDRLTQEIPPAYSAAYIVLSFRDRAELYDRINLRVDKMVRDGLFDEVSSLLSEGISPRCTSMQAIGYKETIQALQGIISREEAIEMIKMSSRRYAKRQLTWFRKVPGSLFLERNTPVSLISDLSACVPFIEKTGPEACSSFPPRHDFSLSLSRDPGC